MSSEPLEIIEVKGISYDKLQSLHKKSTDISSDQAVAIKNLSTVLLQQQQSLLRPSQPLSSSKDVIISKETFNWLLPFYPFKESCHACSYYGHSFKSCPNIISDYRGACLKCWVKGHDSTECLNQKETPPFNEDYKLPEEIIQLLIHNRIV
jgi:hypothetical protein